MKTVAILGSTGSIGKNALKVILEKKSEFKVVALASGSNIGLLAKQIKEFSPKLVAIRDEHKYSSLKRSLNNRTTKLYCGLEGIERVAECGADIVIMAISGTAALLPTFKALGKSKRIALANKECLVMAGDILINEAKRHNTEIIPIDSEHSAIFQCLNAEDRSALKTIYLTGSGGPLKDIAKEKLEFITPEFALKHPRWKMGKKITIDSATLMNKGFEVIEAKYLFNVEADMVKVVIHPEALVHSLVQFVDGTIIAQLAVADMRVPIQYALTYPQRSKGDFPMLNFEDLRSLHFQKPDFGKFPCLRLAYDVLKRGGLAQSVLCSADEECVWAYLEKKISIKEIPEIIEKVLSKLRNKANPGMNEILETDTWAREQVKLRIGT